MENSFMTHQDDREDYSVVHAKTPLVGFFLQQRGNKPSPVYLCGEKCLWRSQFLTGSITGYSESKPVTPLSRVTGETAVLMF